MEQQEEETKTQRRSLAIIINTNKYAEEKHSLTQSRDAGVMYVCMTEPKTTRVTKKPR